MADVEFTDEFEEWWNGLDEAEQESVAAHVGLLERLGVTLGYPHSDGLYERHVAALAEEEQAHG